jgi:hypothetical protein
MDEKGDCKRTLLNAGSNQTSKDHNAKKTTSYSVKPWFFSYFF